MNENERQILGHIVFQLSAPPLLASWSNNALRTGSPTPSLSYTAYTAYTSLISPGHNRHKSDLTLTAAVAAL